jgi:hypothetical protein
MTKHLWGNDQMIECKRYPHVMDLLIHYAKNDPHIELLLAQGISSVDDALALSEFIWTMPAQMAADTDALKPILGGIDNTEMLPDVLYEIRLNLTRLGHGKIWEHVCERMVDDNTFRSNMP